ncbi:hypothetical protein E2C01_036215 [Portunus trituberculatus]|uniref:Uncharacterized protein n=1 Tax=Portunus trituberculatus TaxID=210409 RepID=A0A5B7F846_PORTR|nr:hypothetical protein [Portunus trituberculatus]
MASPRHQAERYSDTRRGRPLLYTELHLTRSKQGALSFAQGDPQHTSQQSGFMGRPKPELMLAFPPVHENQES